MPWPAFLAAAAKLVVLAAAAATAANAASYTRFRRRNLRRISNPINESADPVADFRALPSSSAAAAASGHYLRPETCSSRFSLLNRANNALRCADVIWLNLVGSRLYRRQFIVQLLSPWL